MSATIATTATYKHSLTSQACNHNCEGLENQTGSRAGAKKERGIKAEIREKQHKGAWWAEVESEICRKSKKKCLSPGRAIPQEFLSPVLSPVWLSWADAGHESSLRLPEACRLSLNAWLSAACSHSSWIRVLEDTVLLEKAHCRAQGGQWVSPSSYRSVSEHQTLLFQTPQFPRAGSRPARAS